jgi:DNA-binding ferritin-like protein
MENTELVTIDLKNPTKGIIEFQEVHEQLDDLVEKYDVILDASTEDGYLQTKDAIKVLSGVRIKVEKARKAWKAPVLEAGKAIDKFAKSLETVVVGLEKPMISAKQEQDNKVKQLRSRQSLKELKRLMLLKGSMI